MVKRSAVKGKRALAPSRTEWYILLFMKSVPSHSPEETFLAGQQLSATLAPGTVVTLLGDLGAGKTCFTSGLLAGWGGEGRATSPTFTLLHEYPTPRGPVYHLDLYRAKTAEEIWSATHDEIGAVHALTVIEWADKFPGLVPANAVQVHIAHSGDTSRLITINP
jgi:tRNA threonylcarbamoyladenosine biosynthesis protein TsaE